MKLTPTQLKKIVGSTPDFSEQIEAKRKQLTDYHLVSFDPNNGYKRLEMYDRFCRFADFLKDHAQKLSEGYTVDESYLPRVRSGGNVDVAGQGFQVGYLKPSHILQIEIDEDLKRIEAELVKYKQLLIADWKLESKQKIADYIATEEAKEKAKAERDQEKLIESLLK
jgi:hypothetical protein